MSQSKELYEAAGKGDVQRVRQLVAAKADLEYENILSGRTPLMIATFKGRAEVARVLIAAGANANAKAKNGETPLALAAHHGRAEVARMLLAAGVNANAMADYGMTPLNIAARHRHAEVAQVLLDAGADANAMAD
jgi:ankyrin repeat protein